MKTDIQTIGFEANDDLMAFVNDRLKHLHRYHDKITGIDVYLKSVKNNEEETKVAEIKAFVPGPSLYADYQAESFREAIIESVKKIERQLKKIKDIQNEKR
jgi:putative sigma-54 modulation protein